MKASKPTLPTTTGHHTPNRWPILATSAHHHTRYGPTTAGSYSYSWPTIWPVYTPGPPFGRSHSWPTSWPVTVCHSPPVGRTRSWPPSWPFPLVARPLAAHSRLAGWPYDLGSRVGLGQSPARSFVRPDQRRGDNRSPTPFFGRRLPR